MTALIVVLMCLVFVVIDLVVRTVGRRMDAARNRREREAVLAKSLTLTIASEARSLRRAEVPQPRARILAVDDETIVLDSFRKILVLAGYSVDTVEHGPEALLLVREREYDFVFTDLKMPDMDGLEVVKAVKHLRPDIDVAVITGFGSIETAVETMSQGAVDYVQKPFTEDELVAFANRLVLKREARLASASRPTVRIVAPEQSDAVSDREFCVPGGAFVSPGHAWAQIESGGDVCVGMDDFARKALGRIERIELPHAGAVVRRGDVLFILRRGEEQLRVRAPLSGEVSEANAALQRDAGLMGESPYERGWVCVVRPSRLAEELPGLRIGEAVVGWYQGEVERLRADSARAGGPLRWAELEPRFFSPPAAAPPRPRDPAPVA